MPGVPGRGSRFAGVENRVLQRRAHDEASARVQSTIRERSLQHTGLITGGAESVPPLDRTASAPDLPLRVSRRSRSLATLHSRPDAAEPYRPSVITAWSRGSMHHRHVAAAARCGQGAAPARRSLGEGGQLEKRTVGVPAAFAEFRHRPSVHPAADPDPRKSSATPQRKRASSDPRRRCVFPPVRPRRRGSEVPVVRHTR